MDIIVDQCPKYPNESLPFSSAMEARTSSLQRLLSSLGLISNRYSVDLTLGASTTKSLKPSLQ